MRPNGGWQPGTPKMPVMSVSNRISSNILYQIEEELDEEEKEALSYLCRDVAPDMHTQDTRTLLDTLDKMGRLSPQCLAELLYRVRRFDLLKKVLKTDRRTVEAHLANNQLVSDYRVLMLNIHDEMASDDLDSLNFLLRDVVGSGRLAKNKTFLAVATELEKADQLAPDNLEVLEKHMQTIHRVDLKNRIRKYKQKAPAPAKSFQPLYMNALKASLPNLSNVEPLHSPEAHRPMNGATAAQATAEERVHVSIQESGACAFQDDQYKMQSRPVGICLIIDCIGNDAAELKRTFVALRFEVQCFVCITTDELVRTVQEISVTPKHRNYDCFVCVLISCGNPQAVFGVEQYFHGFALERMRSLFTGLSCPALLGKPKLFFIQTYMVHREPEESTSLVEVDGNGHEPLSNGRRWQSPGIPSEADIFWSQCKVDSSVLQKSSSTPSYYLSCLSQLLRDPHKRKLHLLDIHTELNHRVYERNATSDPRDHCSLHLQHTLRKQLFLTGG